MASISSPGLGSGLDINGLITKLMQAEQQPIVNLNTKEAQYQSKISALGTLKGAVSSIDSALAAFVPASTQTASDKFTSTKASVGDSSAFVSATSSAVAGTYAFEVTQLATSHRISTLPGAFASASSTISQGTLQLTLGDGSPHDIVIDANNNTLGGLRDAINNAKIGVSATIVTVSATDARLVITSGTEGAPGEMTLSGLGGFQFDGTGALVDDFSQGSVTSQRLSTAASAYADANAAIGTGTLQILIGGGAAHDIVIDGSNNTLGGLASAINTANIGVSAAVVQVAAGDARLVLTSNTAGTAGMMTLSSPDGLAGFTYTGGGGDDLTQTVAANVEVGGQAAQGATFKLNGVTIASDTNIVDDAIDGVTITLAKQSTSATTLSVTKDKSSALGAALTALVKAYNDFSKTTKDLGKYDATGGSASGPLLGNSTLRQVMNAIRSSIQGTPEGLTGTYKTLSSIGIEISRDGVMTFNSSKLSTAANADYEGVAKLAAAFGTGMKTVTTSMLSSKGTITAATDGLNRSITDIGKRRTELGIRLTALEERYRKQFNAMDSLVASMNSTSSYLTQQLSALAKLSTGSSKE